ncbi:MAG: hypothetical protein AAGF12_28850 [Myxococcota bacterium]
MLWLVALGCGEAPSEPRCSVSEGSVAARAEGAIDALAAVEHQGALHLFWSDQFGTHYRRHDDAWQGTRITSRCRGGLDAVSGEQLLLACLRPAVPAAGKAGGVFVFEVGARIRAVGRVGVAGAHSEGVDLEMLDGRTHVAWQDSKRRVVWLSTLDDPAPRQISRRGTEAGAPSLGVFDGALVGTWSELVYDDHGDPLGEVVVWTERRGPRRITPVLYPRAQPTLAIDAQSAAVAFRDENPSGTRPRLFVQRLDDELGPSGELLRVGRADGPGGPNVLQCGETWFTASPRSYSTYDILIGLNRFDTGWDRLEPERQLYEAGRRHTHVVALCQDSHPLLVSAENSQAEGPAAVRTTPVNCHETP